MTLRTPPETLYVYFDGTIKTKLVIGIFLINTIIQIADHTMLFLLLKPTSVATCSPLRHEVFSNLNEVLDFARFHDLIKNKFSLHHHVELSVVLQYLLLMSLMLTILLTKYSFRGLNDLSLNDMYMDGQLQNESFIYGDICL